MMQKSLNVKYLACCLVISLLSAGGVHFLHGYQVKRNAGALLTQAYQAEEKGELNQAADYFSRYLRLAPFDTDALARYGLLLADERLARTPKARVRALLVLNSVLRREPERRDVGRRAAHIALDLQRFQDAQEALEKLRKPVPDDREVEQLLARCQEGKGNYKEARKCLENAIKLSPTQIENYERLASLLRNHAEELTEATEETRAQVLQLADRKMDEMVAVNPKSFQAYLARARYRKACASSGETALPSQEIAGDLERARLLAPNDLEVLLAAAEWAQEQHDPQRARDYLQQACREHPRAWRTYQALAKLELLQGRRDEALRCLRDGLRTLPNQAELLWSLAELLVEQDRRGEALEAIASLVKEGIPAAELDYLRAGLLAKESHWHDAVELLEKTYPLLVGLPNSDQDWFISRLKEQTSLLLGRCYEQLGDLERASAAYRRLVARDPRSLPGRLGLAQTRWALGRLEESLDQYRYLLRLPEAPPTAWIEFARLLSERNQQQEQPDWTELNQALDRAEKLKVRPAEVTAMRAEMLVLQAQRLEDPRDKQERFQQARALLQKACKDPRSRPLVIWTALAALEDLEGNTGAALAALDEAERYQGDTVELRLARAQIWYRHPEQDAGGSLSNLRQNLEKFKAEDQWHLLQGVADAYVQRGAFAQAETLYQRLAEQQPYHLENRLVLLDLALRGGNEAAVERQVQELRRMEGDEGSWWRYGEVCHLLWRAKNKGDKEGLGQARRLVTEIARQRPTWPRLPLCEAQIDDLLGNPEAALFNYKRALQAGEYDSSALRRTLELLYERRRYLEAHDLLRKTPRPLLFSADLRRVAAEVSVQVQDNLRARALAEQAVSNSSKDYRDYLWLGQILWAAGEPKKAGQALLRARDLADTTPDTWVALVLFLASTGQTEQALAEIAKAEQRIPKEQAALALAQCYEAVHANARAQALYQQALAGQPDDASALQALAGFFVRTGQYQEAQPYLRKMIADCQSKVPQAAAWARRTLALLLTLSGDYQQSREALALLGADQTDSTLATTADGALAQRAQAWVYALQKDQQERRRAIQLMERVMEQESASPADAFLLAQLYETAGAWPKARKWWLRLIDSKQENAVYLAYFARSMLRHAEVDEAERALTQLQKLEPNGWSTKEIEARLLAAKDKESEAVALLTRQAETPDANLASLAALLEELGQTQAALAMYRRFVAQSKQPESVFALAQFLARQKRFAEALDLCDRAWQSCSAVTAARASLLILSGAADDPGQCLRVERHLQTAIEQNPENLSLLSALVFLRLLQGRYDEAEAACRHILDEDSHNATAMNNLAWVLAFQDGKGADALDWVRRAYRIVGPRPELLDTRALIYLRSRPVDSEIRQAIRDLEEAVAQNPEPAFYFHLAQAYQMIKDAKAARQALREAKVRGLKESSLHSQERMAYRKLLHEFADN
jgi:tetratricopeptide (TPR) repeat protein